VAEIDVIEDLVLGRALAHQAQRVPRAVDGCVESSQEVRDRADVVFVPMRDEEAGDVVPLQRREVRVHDVDAEPSTVEGHTAVDHQHLTSLLEGEAVHANLAEAAEWDEAQ
jgi:hypothetical protein